ncbi:MAG: methylenetetrahydrofolate reductase [NAD(P)H] [Kiritimatiellia bacterium]
MADARISQLLENRKKPLLSFEFFPPKDDESFAALEQTASRLCKLKPDFITVTYGAGGSTRARTLKMALRLREMYNVPVMPHLTCVGSTVKELIEIVGMFYEHGFRNIMALRGDPPRDQLAFVAPEGGLSHASELVSLIKAEFPDIGCGVAGYPEAHPEAHSLETDIDHLMEKVDCGADFVTTQLFFENADFYWFRDLCRARGVTQPILAGLLPVISLPQIKRIMELSQVSFPAALEQKLKEAGEKGPEAEKAGIRWAVEQIEDLLANGVPGIHLYILNRPKTALDSELEDCIHRWHG